MDSARTIGVVIAGSAAFSGILVGAGEVYRRVAHGLRQESVQSPDGKLFLDDGDE